MTPTRDEWRQRNRETRAERRRVEREGRKIVKRLAARGCECEGVVAVLAADPTAHHEDCPVVRD